MWRDIINEYKNKLTLVKKNIVEEAKQDIISYLKFNNDVFLKQSNDWIIDEVTIVYTNQYNDNDYDKECAFYLNIKNTQTNKEAQIYYSCWTDYTCFQEDDEDCDFDAQLNFLKDSEFYLISETICDCLNLYDDLVINHKVER